MERPGPYRDDERCGWTHDVDSGVRMFPRGVTETLTCVEPAAGHRCADHRIVLGTQTAPVVVGDMSSVFSSDASECCGDGHQRSSDREQDAPTMHAHAPQPAHERGNTGVLLAFRWSTGGEPGEPAKRVELRQAAASAAGRATGQRTGARWERGTGED